ncbi:MAG: hypothetical protein IIY62_04395 [Kiritimatiellae bacterium]|nr:hypothetical protein [Kiritimatiellia bacterium]
MIKEQDAREREIRADKAARDENQEMKRPNAACWRWKNQLHKDLQSLDLKRSCGNIARWWMI